MKKTIASNEGVTRNFTGFEKNEATNVVKSVTFFFCFWWQRISVSGILIYLINGSPRKFRNNSRKEFFFHKPNLQLKRSTFDVSQNHHAVYLTFLRSDLDGWPGTGSFPAFFYDCIRSFYNPQSFRFCDVINYFMLYWWNNQCATLTVPPSSNNPIQRPYLLTARDGDDDYDGISCGCGDCNCYCSIYEITKEDLQAAIFAIHTEATYCLISDESTKEFRADETDAWHRAASCGTNSAAIVMRSFVSIQFSFSI